MVIQTKQENAIHLKDLCYRHRKQLLQHRRNVETSLLIYQREMVQS